VFYPLFNALENQTGNNITVFHGKKIEPTINIGSSTVMVETGESRTPPETMLALLSKTGSYHKRDTGVNFMSPTLGTTTPIMIGVLTFLRNNGKWPTPAGT